MDSNNTREGHSNELTLNFNRLSNASQSVNPIISCSGFPLQLNEGHLHVLTNRSSKIVKNESNSTFFSLKFQVIIFSK